MQDARSSSTPIMTLRDSMIGTWVLSGAEAINPSAKHSGQAGKKEIADRISKFQEIFKDFQASFAKDGTYQSQVGHLSDVGTWTINQNREMKTTSKSEGVLSTYKIDKVDAQNLRLKYDAGDDVIFLLNFKRQ